MGNGAAQRGALLRGTPLAEAERWLTERPDDLGTPEQHFIQASRALRTRSVRRLRMVAAVLALLVLAASSLGGVALWQTNQANEKRKQAQSRELVTQANLLASYQPDVAMLLAATAYKIAPTTEAINALTSIASKWRHVDRLLATDMTGESHIAFSPTDPTLVALTNANRIETWDLERNILRSRRDAEGVGTPTFSPNGKIIAYIQNTGQGSNSVLWSHAENQVAREIPLNLAPEESSGKLTFSSDGTLLGACVGRRIQLWSLDTGRPHRSVPLTHDSTACAFGFRNESREIAYIDGDDIITWDIAASRVLTMDQLRPPKRRQSSPLSSRNDQFFFDKDSIFTVAPDGRSAIYQGKIHIGNGAYSYSGWWWDFDRRQAQEIDSDTDSGPSFTPDGRHVAIAQYRSVTIFDVAKRTPLAAYPKTVNSGIIGDRASVLSPDGHTIATLHTETSNLISLTGTNLYHGIPVSAILVAIQPDKKHLAAVSYGGKVAIYSIENRNLEPIVVRSPVDDQPNEKRVESLSPNSLYYAFTDERAQKVRLLEISSPLAPETPLEGNNSDVLQLSFDPHGDFLARADKSEIMVWSTKDHAKKTSIPLSLSRLHDKRIGRIGSRSRRSLCCRD